MIQKLIFSLSGFALRRCWKWNYHDYGPEAICIFFNAVNCHCKHVRFIVFLLLMFNPIELGSLEQFQCSVLNLSTSNRITI